MLSSVVRVNRIASIRRARFSTKGGGESKDGQPMILYVACLVVTMNHFLQRRLDSAEQKLGSAESTIQTLRWEVAELQEQVAALMRRR